MHFSLQRLIAFVTVVCLFLGGVIGSCKAFWWAANLLVRLDIVRGDSTPNVIAGTIIILCVTVIVVFVGLVLTAMLCKFLIWATHWMQVLMFVIIPRKWNEYLGK